MPIIRADVAEQAEILGTVTERGIPYSIAPCFQEYDLETLDPMQHSGLIIERVLSYGDRKELRWLFARYGRSPIKIWVQERGARCLPWRRYNLWCVLLGLGQAVRPKERRIWVH